MKRPRRRAAGKGPPPKRRSGDPFPKPRPRPKSVRPILGLPRNHAGPAEEVAARPATDRRGSRTVLAAVGFFTILGVTLAIRAAASELDRQTQHSPVPALLMVGVMLLGIGARVAATNPRVRSGESAGAPPDARPGTRGDRDAVAFTAFAVAVGALVAAAAFAEPLRAAITSRLEMPSIVLLALVLAPLLVAAAIASCIGAHVISVASAWFDAAGRRVLTAGVIAGVAGSVTPLGRQGVLIVAPLALFVAALIVLLRHPAARGASASTAPLPIAPRPRPRGLARGCLIAAAAALLAAAALGWPAAGPRSTAASEDSPAAVSLPEPVARRWDVRQAISGAAAIAESDLHSLETPTLLVAGGDGVGDDDAPRLAARLARASRGVGRILFEQPASQRLVRRVRRELRRGGEFPPAYVIRFRDGAQAFSLIAVGFDVPAWLDARPLPSEYHLEFGLLDAPGPRGSE